MRTTRRGPALPYNCRVSIVDRETIIIRVFRTRNRGTPRPGTGRVTVFSRVCRPVNSGTDSWLIPSGTAVTRFQRATRWYLTTRTWSGRFKMHRVVVADATGRGRPLYRGIESNFARCGTDIRVFIALGFVDNHRNEKYDYYGNGTCVITRRRSDLPVR